MGTRRCRPARRNRPVGRYSAIHAGWWILAHWRCCLPPADGSEPPAGGVVLPAGDGRLNAAGIVACTPFPKNTYASQPPRVPQPTCRHTRAGSIDSHQPTARRPARGRPRGRTEVLRTNAMRTTFPETSWTRPILRGAPSLPTTAAAVVRKETITCRDASLQYPARRPIKRESNKPAGVESTRKRPKRSTAHRDAARPPGACRARDRGSPAGRSESSRNVNALSRFGDNSQLSVRPTCLKRRRRLRSLAGSSSAVSQFRSGGRTRDTPHP